MPPAAERRRDPADETKALPRPAIERPLTRRDVPLREKALWRMLYETAARAAEVLALNVEDLDLAGWRAPVRSKGGATQWVYWGSGTAHLLPRLLRLPDGTARARGPLFLSERRPGPARRPAAADVCPHTGRARLGYDRARILLDHYTSPGDGRPGWDLHQLVGGDVADAGGAGDPGDGAVDGGLADPAAALDEQVVAAQPGRPARQPAVEELLELGVQGDVTVGAELADRHVQPVRRADLHDGVDGQVQKLALAQARWR